MASVKPRDLLTGAVLILFLAVCFYLHKLGEPGPWHAKAISLWDKEEWGKIQALGDNLFRVRKPDPEAYYLAMMASMQSQNFPKAKVFAEHLSETRVLNWKMETELAKVYQPDSLRKRVSIFRTRIVYALLLSMILILALSILRKEPFRIAPISIAAIGIIAILL
jgi:hypothetical protein